MEGVVSPFDHRYVSPALEVRSTESPGQKLVGPEAVIVGALGGVKRLIVSAAEDGLRQVVASVT